MAFTDNFVCWSVFKYLISLGTDFGIYKQKVLCLVGIKVQCKVTVLDNVLASW